MSFYETDRKEVVGFFNGKKEHVSYPDRMHGGLISTILDETMGRAIEIDDPERLGVTMEIKVRFKRPVPVGIELRAVGRVVSETSRTFSCTGEILGPDGGHLATAEATYMKINNEAVKQTNSHFFSDEMFYSDEIEDKEFIDY